MSEKRFRANFDVSIYDSEKEEYISVSDRGLEEIAKRMNEQQDQINSLILSIKAKDRHIKNQQVAIKKLQDLCGESDSENAKLRIENKKLKAKLREKEEDERLYANEILELRETNKEHIKFKSLGGNY